MKIGDKVILSNWDPLSVDLLNIRSKIGSTFTLKSQHTAHSLGYSDAAKSHFGNSVIWSTEENVYLPDGCVHLVSPGEDFMFEPGDMCRVVNQDGGLDKANLPHHTGILTTLIRKSNAGVGGYINLPAYTTMWVTSNGCWYPEFCLQLVRSVERPGLAPPLTFRQPTSIRTFRQPTSIRTDSKKENNSMNIFRVSFIQTPTVIAQQSGAVDTMLVPSTEVLADSQLAAVAIVAANNAEKIMKADGVGKLRVCAVQQVC